MVIFIRSDSDKAKKYNTNTWYDKIKYDLNIGRDRLILISLNSDLGTWADLSGKIGDLILRGCSSQISQYDDESRRIDQQRLVPGWNFLHFFLQKEATGLTFEMLELYNDALYQYDELEIAYFQTMEEQGAPWFKAFGGMSPTDDAIDIFTGNDNETRNCMVNGTITIFDFRIYLFHRQCMLLDKMKSPLEIMKRSLQFIPIFARTLTDYQPSLKPCFREAWIYGMVTSIVSHCNELSAISEKQENQTQIFEGIKGELYHLVRFQLDRLGVARDLLSHSLHCNVNFIPESNGDVSPDLTSSSGINLNLSNSTLMDALQSKAVFDAAYQDWTKKCIKIYESCNRKPMARFLMADLAYLHLLLFLM